MNERRDTLDAWLAAARTDLAQQRPPQWIESALLARQSERALLRQLQRRPSAPAVSRKPRDLRWWLGLPAGLVALLALATGVIVLAPVEAPAGAQRPAFMALTALETIAAEARPVVIASDVPRAQLAAFGLPVDPARADRPVRAEFLVSRHGAVLAVRFSPE